MKRLLLIAGALCILPSFVARAGKSVLWTKKECAAFKTGLDKLNDRANKIYRPELLKAFKKQGLEQAAIAQEAINHILQKDPHPKQGTSQFTSLKKEFDTLQKLQQNHPKTF